MGASRKMTDDFRWHDFGVLLQSAKNEHDLTVCHRQSLRFPSLGRTLLLFGLIMPAAAGLSRMQHDLLLVCLWSNILLGLFRYLVLWAKQKRIANRCTSTKFVDCFYF